MQDQPSSPQQGTGSLSTAEAIDLLLDANTPSDKEESEVQTTQETESPETETEEVEVAEELTETDEAEEQEEEQPQEEEVLYRVKVDGEEYDVNSEELVKNYQLEQTAQKRLQDAATQRKELQSKEASLEQERQKYSQVLQHYENQLKNPQSSLTDEQWARLREEDPIAYNTAKIEEQERGPRLQAVQQEQQVVKSQELAKQADILLDLIPTWKDQATATKEKGDLVQYLRTNGFSNDDINGATDARIINIARKAQLYDNLQSKANVVKKKVVTAPKMIKAGTPKAKVDANTKKQKDAWTKLTKSGSKEDAVAYLLSKNS